MYVRIPRKVHSTHCVTTYIRTTQYTVHTTCGASSVQEHQLMGHMHWALQGVASADGLSVQHGESTVTRLPASTQGPLDVRFNRRGSCCYSQQIVVVLCTPPAGLRTMNGFTSFRDLQARETLERNRSISLCGIQLIAVALCPAPCLHSVMYIVHVQSSTSPLLAFWGPVRWLHTACCVLQGIRYRASRRTSQSGAATIRDSSLVPGGYIPGSSIDPLMWACHTYILHSRSTYMYVVT